MPNVKLPRKRAKETKPRLPYDRVEDKLRPLIVKVLRSRGFKTYRIETSIAHQLGIADFFIAHRSGRWGGFMELKSPTGTQTPEQIEFEELCKLNNIPYIIVRSVEEAEKL